jgi:hypothetical protein
MEVVEVGKTKGTTVYCDKNAWEADHIAVVGRINAHPDFTGEIESGLFKMMAIGLGKRHGASTTIAPGSITATPKSFRSSGEPSEHRPYSLGGHHPEQL